MFYSFFVYLVRSQTETKGVLMPNAGDRKRTGRLNVRLEQEMIDRLEELSVELCIAPATIGALAIADYVNSRLANKKMQERTAQLVADRTGQAMEGIFSDPATLKLMASVIESDDDSQQRLEGV